jgi:hypothetical protein
MKAPTKTKSKTKADPLTLEIELNPNQQTALPKIINAINDDPSSDLFAKITIRKNKLRLNCYDLFELMNSELLTEFEKIQLKTQARKAIDALKANASLTANQIKNFSAAIAVIQ